MSSAFPRCASAIAIGLVIATMGCEREARHFDTAPTPPDVRAQVKERIRVEVAPLQSEQQVDAYLAVLRGRARRKFEPPRTSWKA